jgi:hypothetical protein
MGRPDADPESCACSGKSVEWVRSAHLANSSSVARRPVVTRRSAPEPSSRRAGGSGESSGRRTGGGRVEHGEDGAGRLERVAELVRNPHCVDYRGLAYRKGGQIARAAARPAARPLKMQPPRNVPSRAL